MQPNKVPARSNHLRTAPLARDTADTAKSTASFPDTASERAANTTMGVIRVRTEVSLIQDNLHTTTATREVAPLTNTEPLASGVAS